MDGNNINLIFIAINLSNDYIYDTMKELDIIVQDLKKYLESKELELKQDPNFNAYTLSHLQNRQSDIVNFQFAAKNCETDPFFKNQIIKNFKKEANKIKSEIDAISVK